MTLDPKFSPKPFVYPEALVGKEQIQFHFGCYALCEIGFYEDAGDRAVDSVKLLGFWPSREEAHLASSRRELCLRVVHEAQYKVTNGRWPPRPWNHTEYKPNHYEIVSLSSVRFDDLDSLERAIEDAAKARVCGIGVEVTPVTAQSGGAA